MTLHRSAVSLVFFPAAWSDEAVPAIGTAVQSANELPAHLRHTARIDYHPGRATHPEALSFAEGGVPAPPVAAGTPSPPPMLS